MPASICNCLDFVLLGFAPKRLTCRRRMTLLRPVMPKNAVSESHVTFELSEHLPYLFKNIHSQLEFVSAGQLAQFGVNAAVWRILVVLWEHDDLSHRDLSDLTSIDVSTLSRVSAGVQRRGLIRRKRTKEDQRTVRVTLTNKGRALVKSVIPWALGCQAAIVGDLSAEEINVLTAILHKIVVNLNVFAEVHMAETVVSNSGNRNSNGAAPARKPPVKKPARKRIIPLPVQSGSGLL